MIQYYYFSYASSRTRNLSLKVKAASLTIRRNVYLHVDSHISHVDICFHINSAVLGDAFE